MIFMLFLYKKRFTSKKNNNRTFNYLAKELDVAADNPEAHHISLMYVGRTNEPLHKKTCLREFVTRYNSNRPAQLQRLARALEYGYSKYRYYTI